jgi:recombination associated protein RdgC
MIKNAYLYRIVGEPADNTPLEERLQAHGFEPCGATQESSMGWISPREQHGLLCESVDQQWILKLATESKKVPSAAIDRELKKRSDAINEATGRKPGKKERAELKEDIRLALLPHAFPTLSTTLGWIGKLEDGSRILLVDAPTQSRADDFIAMLIKSIEGLAIAMVNTCVSPTATMTSWLLGEVAPPRGFTIDQDCELKAADESKACIKFTNKPLDTPEIQAYVASGMLPTRLAMTFDDRVSFVMTESGAIKKIDILDVATTGDDGMGNADAFDANVIITTRELGRLIPEFLDVLGGEVSLKAQEPLE